MNERYINQIEPVNYWTQPPKNIRYIRQDYLQRILSYLDTQVLKVLVGQRRCGKSTLLKQVIAELIHKGTSPNNILYLNFELHQLHFINSQSMLNEVIEAYYHERNPKGKVYLFLDEIQEIDSWERTVNSFLANERFDIDFFLTGSNANLLSTELSTYVTGRYIEIPVFPFSFKEFCQYQDVLLSRDAMINYLEDSGLPELFELPEKQQKTSYLSALQDSILMNDVVKRFSVKHPKLLIFLLDFLIDNIGKLFSMNAIAKKFKSMGVNINLGTLTNYIHYLELTFLIHSARRYDIKGKKILEGERKYYLNDLGFNNYLKSSFDNTVTRRLENHVYLTLLQAGYQVYVGNIYQLEIDFVAEKENKIIYIQVTYLLHGEEVIEREYGNLEKIKDNWPKWVVSLDDIKLGAKNGIEHIQAWRLGEHL